ncbi:MAG: hypothetical protein CME06_04300 [Gemmatimonadetes bacterium]|nr:hypothetical protein [Gemmatimonadota bacterium]
MRGAGFSDASVESAQLLNDEISSRLPHALLGPYVAFTRFLEARSKTLRGLFGLHITARAVK